MEYSLALVLVVYHNTEAVISRVLDQWARQDYPPHYTYIVTNSPLQLSDQFSHLVRIVDPGSNIGFTGGVNMAARAARDDGCTHLMLSNLDVQLLSSGLVTQLLEVFSARPDCVFASPGIVMWPETWRIWYRGAHVLRPIWLTRHPHIGRRWQGPSRGAIRTGYFSGCCVLIELERFLILQGFDQSLFMYYDEVELANRALDHGWTCWLLDEPLIAHSKTNRQLYELDAYWHARNSSILLHRHEHGVRHVAGRLGQWIVVPFQLLRCNSWYAGKAYMAGFFGHPRPVGRQERRTG